MTTKESIVLELYKGLQIDKTNAVLKLIKGEGFQLILIETDCFQNLHILTKHFNYFRLFHYENSFVLHFLTKAYRHKNISVKTTSSSTTCLLNSNKELT